MLTTTFFDSLVALGGLEGTQVVAKKAPKPSFASRIVAALVESRQRQANREIRRIAALHGYDAQRFGRSDLPF